MEFSPFNKIVKICIQGMEKEDQGKMEEARKIFHHGWDEASSDFEKFLTAHYLSRHQQSSSGKLIWLEKTLDFALKVNDDSVNSALPSLYSNIAKCYEELGNIGKAKDNYDLSASHKNNPSDKGPFITEQKRI
jgi:rifampin ADP-ribosylating transferase